MARGAPDVVGLGYCVHDTLAIVKHVPDFDDVHVAHVADLVSDGGGQVGTGLTALARLGASAGCRSSLQLKAWTWRACGSRSRLARMCACCW
jgi:hypothetical protein